MYDRISNVESDADLKTRAMAYILREICLKYKKQRDPTFSQKEIHDTLQGLGPEYINLNIRDLFKGSGYIEIDENLNLKLDDKGKQDCEDQQMQ
jgi:hypothetical protein